MSSPLLYLSGPMTGLLEFNYPAVHAAAARLRAAGFRVYNPAESPWARVDGGFNAREAFADYARVICLEADGLALMPGWQASVGAVAEYALARACGIPARLVEDIEVAP